MIIWCHVERWRIFKQWMLKTVFLYDSRSLWSQHVPMWLVKLARAGHIGLQASRLCGIHAVRSMASCQNRDSILTDLRNTDMWNSEDPSHFWLKIINRPSPLSNLSLESPGNDTKILIRHSSQSRALQRTRGGTLWFHQNLKSWVKNTRGAQNVHMFEQKKTACERTTSHAWHLPSFNAESHTPPGKSRLLKTLGFSQTCSSPFLPLELCIFKERVPEGALRAARGVS